jgi:dihydropteroate synthase
MLRLGRREFGAHEPVIMAIVNRTPDSFYDRGATFRDEPALARVEQAVAEGAAIIDIGGVKAGPGEEVTAEEEARRTVGFVAEVRRRYPDVVISVDTWRHDVGEAVCEAGADVLNDAWGGADPKLAEVAARYGAGLVCTHAGGAEPRTRPHRAEYDDVVADILRVTVGLAERAVELGVRRDGIMIDPGHDFGKNTRHSLEATRRLGEMTETGWPVLVSLSNKDFVGETLDRPVKERVLGTLATTAVSAWLGARVYRVHEVAETKQVLDMVASIAGHRPGAVPPPPAGRGRPGRQGRPGPVSFVTSATASSTSSVTWKSSRSCSDALPWAMTVPRSQSTRPDQYSVPNSTIGKRVTFRVWTRVSASNSSSRVPSPPGRTTKPWAYLTNIVFRTKK